MKTITITKKDGEFEFVTVKTNAEFDAATFEQALDFLDDAIELLQKLRAQNEQAYIDALTKDDEED